MFLDLFVNDFIHFSASSQVEEAIASRIGKCFDVDFQEDINRFLGINFKCTRDEDNHVMVHMSQQNDALDLIIKAQLDAPATASATPPTAVVTRLTLFLTLTCQSTNDTS